jgi:hypothetical protein
MMSLKTFVESVKQDQQIRLKGQYGVAVMAVGLP